MYRQPIHLTSNLHIGGLLFWNRALFDAGCRLVGDVYRPDGHIKSFDELNRDFPIPFSKTVLQGLIRAIRRFQGSQIMSFEFVGPLRPKAVECLFVQSVGNRSVYVTLLDHFCPALSDLSSAELKWNRDLDTEIDWSTVYWSNRSCTRNKKIVWFQDRLLHRILTTNQFVSKFTDTNPECSFCKRDTETLIHLFCRCYVISGLWSEVKRAASMSGVAMSLDEKNIIMGTDIVDKSVSDTKRELVRQIILLFKFYIYRAKVASGSMDFSSACAYVKAMVVADCPVRDAEISDKERLIIDAHDWAINMLNQWMSRTV